MEILSGKAVFGGVAVGRLAYSEKRDKQVRRYKPENTDKELERFEKAKAQASLQLQGLYEKALKEVGEDNAAIFEVHKMMLEDGDFNEAVRDKIVNQQVNAEYAAAKTGDDFFEIFDNMEDEYFKARTADMKDIANRLISCLEGSSAAELREPSIIAAKELAPSETIQLDREKLLAFVTELGSSNSHTAILAKSMNLPAIIGIKVDKSQSGKLAIADGNSGRLIIDPD
ncbi:MAG: phosphoenolpyruvate--protein phosphotransferase, partial [Clostridiales bacterium]|nr:phosphoenolpyruvate--protein phosphotransferase [Clostridiales bacterium]